MHYLIALDAVVTGLLSLAGLCWVLRKAWRLLLAMFIAGSIAGCSTVSNRFDKSPCACDFKPLNTINVQEMGHA